MKWLSVFGIALILYAFFVFDPSRSGINNIGLLNQQMMMTVVGCALLIGGIIGTVFGSGAAKTDIDARQDARLDGDSPDTDDSVREFQKHQRKLR